MRKSSKLLAVLLTLCLLFGAITAIFASADGETATPTLNVGDAQGKSYTTTDAAKNFLRAQTITQDLYFANFKYMVIDLDFNLVPGTTAPSGFYFDTGLMIDGGTQKATSRLYVVEKDGSFYMSFSQSKADLNENAKVSNTSGLYDHLTYVFKIDNSTAGKCTLTPSFYVNGTFIAEGTATTFDVSTSIALYRPANKATAWNGAKFSDKNYVINYYKPGTDNTVALEKALENNAPLYRFEGYNSKLGVVYNANYVTPDAATNYVTVNGTKHTLVGKAMDAIATWTGADNALTVSGRDLCATIPDGVTSFKVTLEGDDASFSYNASTSYVATTDGDTITYTLPSTDNFYVTINGGDKLTTVAAAKEAIAAIPNDATIVVVGMELTDVVIPYGVKKFTVETENATFDLSDVSAARFVQNGNTYTYKQITVTNDCNGTGSYVLGTTGHANSAATGFEYNNSAKSLYMRVSYVNSSYVRIHYDKDNGLYGETPISFDADAKHHRESELVWRAYGYYNAATDLKNFKYFTLDFDFCADAYAYTFVDGENTYYATAKTVEEAIAKLKDEQNVTLSDGYTVVNEEPQLAYPTGLVFKPQLQSSEAGITEAPANKFAVGSNDAGWDYVDGRSISVRKLEDGWYIGSGDKVARLSDEPGVFNHVTYVYEISVVDGVFNAIPHVYVNGEYVLSFSTVKGIGSFDHFQQLMVDFYAEKTDNTFGDRMYDKYSLAFDNMAVTYYHAEDLADTTLDEKLESKAPLYTMGGVVYNENYVTPNPERYVEFKGDKYYVINAGFSKMSDRNSIYVYNVGEGYIPPAGFNLNSFYVYVKSGDFSFDASFAEKYAAPSIETDGAYFYELLRSYVLLNDVETPLEDALAALKDGDVLKLFSTNVTDFNKELTSFTVICDKASSFTFASTFPEWRYAKIGDTYKRVMDGDVYASVDLGSNMTSFNIYIPISEGVKYTNVSYSVLTGTSKDGNIKNGGTQIINGVTYQVLYWSGRMDMFAKTAYPEFTYTEGETTVTLTRFKANFDLLAYVQEVLTYDNYKKCGSEEAQLMKAIVDYRVAYMEATSEVDTKNNVSAGHLAAAATDLANIKAIYTAHGEACKCGEYKIEADYINVGAKNEDLKLPAGVSFSIGLGGLNRSFNLIVNVDTEVAALASANCVAVTYIDVYGAELTAYAAISDGHASLPAFTAADFDNVLEISIGVATYTDEEVVDSFAGVENYTFDYSIYDLEAADYSATKTGLDKEAVEKLLTAIKNYALAAENYKKYPKATTPEDALN